MMQSVTVNKVVRGGYRKAKHFCRPQPAAVDRFVQMRYPARVTVRVRKLRRPSPSASDLKFPRASDSSLRSLDHMYHVDCARRYSSSEHLTSPPLLLRMKTVGENSLCYLETSPPVGERLITLPFQIRFIIRSTKFI